MKRTTESPMMVAKGKGATTCEGLQIGSYPAVAGATIAPGETGPILITACDGTVVKQAKNHSNCTFYLGNSILATVDPCCSIHFTGCGGSEPAECCDRPIAVCVEGVTQLLYMDGPGWKVISFSDRNRCCEICSDGRSWFLTISGSCPLSGHVVHWALWCNGDQYDWELIDEGTWDWSGVCDDPRVGYEETITIGECELKVIAAPEIESDMCLRCDKDPPAETCCDLLRWFCLGSSSVQLALDGGTHSWDVSVCCGCPGATLEIRLSCRDNIVTLQHIYTCDTTVQIGAITLSTLCVSNDPILIKIFGACYLELHITLTEQECESCDPCESDPDNCVVTSCCVDAIPKVLSLVIVGGAFAGTYSMTYDGMLEWINDTGAFSARMSCSISGWQMSFEMDTYGADDCPPLSFDVTGNGYGITSMVVS